VSRGRGRHPRPGLSKRYALGPRARPGGHLREAIADFAAAPLRRLARRGASSSSAAWGSLHEVGAGFHPELTGRENIYLNGTILGMRKREIDGKLDEIVAFAEVEPFVDTAVKRYSSGMYVRLAFAVAAHLDTEIMLVDEVLAVGDVDFQKKCLGKMDDVAQAGRTIVFVSHNTAAVQRLCGRGALLDRGALAAAAPSARSWGATWQATRPRGRPRGSRRGRAARRDGRASPTPACSTTATLPSEAGPATATSASSSRSR
jgi:ABC-type multidrug transport system ATPase subunit